MTERLDNRQFELLTMTIAAVLATHLAHLPPVLGVAFAILLGLRAWTRRRGAAAVVAWIRLPLTLLLVALVVASFGNLFGKEPGTQLGCGLLALKLLETERVRDARVAAGFGAFVLMSALLFTQTLLFTLLICAVLVLLIAGLVALQPAPRQRSLFADLRVATLLLGAGLPLALAAFVLVPRLGAPLWGAPGNESLSRTGLGDSMAPGQFTDLLVDDSPAFRVTFAEAPPAPPQLYFRSIVLWDFDGTTWFRGPLPGYRRIENIAADTTQAAAIYDYTLALEATGRRWLPALDMPVAAPTDARFTAERMLVTNTPVTQPRAFALQSQVRYVLSATLDAGERTRALALPAGFDPDTHALAARWRREGRDDAGVVGAALQMFNASFTYTLSPPLLGRNSVDDFLFGTRSGFCEHYASAFVVLMRAAGIPARVVTGYQGGWWNASGRYLLVRQSDAHAWAEIWRGGRGWVRVDPTAAVSPARIERGAAAASDRDDWSQAGWLRGLRNRFDFANRLWTQGIIQFNALRQKALLARFGVADANHGDLLLALSGALAVAMLLATIWAMSGAPRPRGDALDEAWQRLRTRLRRGGLSERPNEGPFDLLRRARIQQPPAFVAELEPLVREYVALRYGVAAAPQAQVAAFARAVRRLRAPPRPLRRTDATTGHSATSG